MNSIMSTEIREQPEAVARTLERLLPLRAALRSLAQGRRSVLFIARGSSDNAAVFGRYLLETHAGVRSALAAPSVGTHYDAALDLSDVLVVSISQSGATEEIVAAQDWARRRGAATIAVTNAAGSPLATSADRALTTAAGEEHAVPATKTYTAQLAAMAVLGTALAPHPTTLDTYLDRVPDEMARLIGTHGDLDAAVELLAAAQGTLVSARGLLMGTALETALKLEETCLRPVRGLSYADLRHGPIAMVSEEVVAILISPVDGPLLAGMTKLATDLRRRGVGSIVGIGGQPPFAKSCHVALPGPDLPETLAPLAAIIPGQLLAEALSRHLGVDPDAPRGLNKVTQTEGSPQ